MKEMRFLMFGFALMLFQSCGNEHTKRHIILQPFGNFPDKETQLVKNGLVKFYGVNVVIAKSIALPDMAYYVPQNRYSADSLLKHLSPKKGDAFTIIGLTDHDVYTAKNDNPHWGVMGLGTLSADASVISTFRLHKGALLNDELVKLAAHELGHNFGLPHCPDKSCIMADAEGHNNFYRETGLCAKCRDKLGLP